MIFWWQLIQAWKSAAVCCPSRARPTSEVSTPRNGDVCGDGWHGREWRVPGAVSLSDVDAGGAGAVINEELLNSDMESHMVIRKQQHGARLGN